jgi:FkbM family methyltransferase
VVLAIRNGKKLNFEVRDSIDFAVLWQIFVREDYDISRLARSKDLFARYEETLQAQKTPLIIDCGANIGLSAAYFAEVFPGAKLVAIEPEEGNFRLARRNCVAANIDFVHAAIASEDTAGILIDPGLGGWGYRVAEQKAGDLRMMSINGILADPIYSASEPFIVKIDIEGFEAELFSKNTEWVDQFPLLIIELHDWMLPRERTSANFLSVMARLDRDFVHIGENIFSISNRLV